MNHILFIVTLIICAFFVAKMEINIEGKDGWAKKLPTWRLPFEILGKKITGYHLYLLLVIYSLIHVPLFITGTFNWIMELRLLSFFILLMLLEDFLWFVLNPYFGLKKFNRSVVTWHTNWLMGLPTEYYVSLFVGVFIYSLTI